jgi:methylglutaconyl-CoA hydratase
VSGLSVRRSGAVVRLTLDRPEVKNAFDGALIETLAEQVEKLHGDKRARVVVLSGAGAVFSAGADLSWMRAVRDASFEENLSGARRLAELLRAIDTLPQATIAAVNGPAVGGALGLIAACDIVIAVESAHFAFTEARLGLVPAVVSPYVVRRIGHAAARRLFVSSTRFTVEEAFRIGLVDEATNNETFEHLVQAWIKRALACAPGAVADAKKLVDHQSFAIDDKTLESTARLIAERRRSEEGQEGMDAFFSKRKPNWVEE